MLDQKFSNIRLYIDFPKRYLYFENLIFAFIRRLKGRANFLSHISFAVSHSMHSLCLSSPHPFMMCPLFLNQLEARAALSFIAIYHATSYRRSRNSSTFIDRKVNVHRGTNFFLPLTIFDIYIEYIYAIKIVLKIFLNRAEFQRE